MYECTIIPIYFHRGPRGGWCLSQHALGGQATSPKQRKYVLIENHIHTHGHCSVLNSTELHVVALREKTSTHAGKTTCTRGQHANSTHRGPGQRFTLRSFLYWGQSANHWPPTVHSHNIIICQNWPIQKRVFSSVCWCRQFGAETGQVEDKQLHNGNNFPFAFKSKHLT